MLEPTARVGSFQASVIREMTRLANRYGAINCAQGFPDFPPPAELTAALAVVAAGPAHQYSVTWGTPNLLQALGRKVADWWGQPVDAEVEITVTCGVTEGIVSAFATILEPGDEVIILEPAHENYYPAALLCGAVVRWVALRPPDFRLPNDDIRKAVTPRTRAVVLNTPHNPTGRVFSAAELLGLAAVCQECDLILVTDEIYEHLTFDGLRHLAPATLPGMRERTIAVSGLGKIMAATGWRMGYIVAPPALSDGVRKCHDYTTICAPTPLQEAMAMALHTLPPEYYAEVRSAYERRRNRFVQALDEAGFHPVKPEGAYYTLADVSSLGFADGRACVEWMVREVGLAAVPGASFYGGSPEVGRQLLRFAFCKRDETLDKVEAVLHKLAATRAH